MDGYGKGISVTGALITVDRSVDKGYGNRLTGFRIEDKFTFFPETQSAATHFSFGGDGSDFFEVGQYYIESLCHGIGLGFGNEFGNVKRSFHPFGILYGDIFNDRIYKAVTVTGGKDHGRTVFIVNDGKISDHKIFDIFFRGVGNEKTGSFAATGIYYTVFNDLFHAGQIVGQTKLGVFVAGKTAVGEDDITSFTVIGSLMMAHMTCGETAVGIVFKFTVADGKFDFLLGVVGNIEAGKIVPVEFTVFKKNFCKSGFTVRVIRFKVDPAFRSSSFCIVEFTVADSKIVAAGNTQTLPPSVMTIQIFQKDVPAVLTSHIYTIASAVSDFKIFDFYIVTVKNTYGMSVVFLFGTGENKFYFSLSLQNHILFLMDLKHSSLNKSSSSFFLPDTFFRLNDNSVGKIYFYIRGNDKRPGHPGRCHFFNINFLCTGVQCRLKSFCGILFIESPPVCLCFGFFSRFYKSDLFGKILCRNRK